MTMAGGPLMNVVRLYRKDVMTQLHVEEALFRSTSSNWLVINDGVKDQSIVLGISGKPEVMVHEREARDRGVPLIKRFTGGGTVVVDEDTVMMSIIVNGEKDLPHVGCFPRQIMEWCEGFLSHHMTTMFGDFRLREHDFVVGDKKIGGNAQAISGGRWLHHTSFLYDYKDDAMALLRHPPKTPEYRQGRDHNDFVTRLRTINSDRESFIRGIIDSVENNGFKPNHVTESEVMRVLDDVYSSNTNKPSSQTLLGSKFI